jgi:WD40 repeat protein
MADSIPVTSEKIFKYKIQQNVSTVAGKTDDNGHGSMVDGTLDEAAFLYPYSLAIDEENNLFVVQRQGVATPSTGGVTQAYRLVALNENQVTTRLSAGGEFSSFRAIAFSLSQDTLWCTNDTWSNGGVSLFTITRGQGWYNSTGQHFETTTNGVAINPVDGSILYSCYQKSIIRYFDQETGSVKDLMTIGENYVVYLCFSPDGKYLYLSIPEGYQAERGKVYRAEWHPDTKTLTDAEMIISLDYLRYPEQIACDADGNLYICDSGNNTIELWDPKTRTVSTFAGVRGEAGYLDDVPLKSKFNSPTGICIAKDGTIYVADNGNHRIRKIVVE